MASVDHLAGGDVRLYKDITSLPMHLCFMKLIFDKEKFALEKKAIERSTNKYKRG